MIAMSRKRTKSTESAMLTPAVKAKRNASATGKSSQVQAGSTPKAKRKTKTITRLTPKLRALVTTVESGITRRGNWVLRTMPSWETTEVTELVVASWKKVKRTMPSSSITG